MRLDRFLWWARLARTRSAAQTIAERGRLRIDGRPVDRAHVCVRVGHVLTFVQGRDGEGPSEHGRVRVLKVAALPSRRGPAAEAQGCYVDLVQPTGVANVSHEAAAIDAAGKPGLAARPNTRPATCAGPEE